MVENNAKSDFHSYFSFEYWSILCNTSSRSDTRGWVCVSKFPKALMRHRASASSSEITGKVMGMTDDSDGSLLGTSESSLWGEVLQADRLYHLRVT